MRLPPVTHTLDISSDFSSLQEIADTYAKGMAGLDARTQEAVTVTVISAFFRYPNYLFEWQHHLHYPDRCSRLFYAVLYARWGCFLPDEPNAPVEKLQALDAMARMLELFLDDQEYHLFADNTIKAQRQTIESKRAHLISAMTMNDIHQKVPGLAQKDPEYREPEMTEIIWRQKRLCKKSNIKTFAYLGNAQ